MSIIKIKKAFERKMLDLTNIDTVYEGDEYTPTEGIPYQRLLHLPQDPLNPTFGDSYRREVGDFTIFLNYPTKDSILAKERAIEIQAMFFRGMTIQEEDLKIIIERTPAVSSGTQIADRYILPVRIRYFASVFTG